MLAHQEDEAGQPAFFGQRDFERPAEQLWHVEGRVHPPELVEAIGMDACSSTVCVAAIERVPGWHRLFHLRVQFHQFVQDAKIWPFLAEVAHAHEVQQDAFERRVTGALAFAKRGAVDGAAAGTDGRQAVGDYQPGIVVRVKLQICRLQAQLAHLRKNARDAARQRYILIGQAQPHRIADAKFRAQFRAIWRADLQRVLDKGTHEVHRRARGVFQVQAGANARVQRHFHRLKVGLRRLVSAAGLELVEGVVIRGRGQHTGFAHAQAANQHHIFCGGANPRRRLNGRASPVAFQRPLQRGAIRGTIDEKLGLANRPGFAGEAAQDVINVQALFGSERKPALLAVTVRRLGRPRLGG